MGDTEATSSGQTLPTGTVTFLFTDIEGSTKLAQRSPDQWEVLRERHHAILQAAMEAYNGYVFQIIGDAFCVAFHTAGDAIRAAAKSQIDVCAADWDDTPIKVRMGIHAGKAEVQGNGEYHGYLAMSRVQRLMSAGHGGQVLLSATAQELVLEDLPEGISLRDLGEHRLKDLIHPEHIYQLVVPVLPTDFPPLKSLDSYRHNLPVQLTSFIGREREVQQVKELMMKSRLVTLTGAGGTGKTRLALQVGAEVVDNFEDGVWFVELASLSDPALVPQALATTLGVREQAGRLMMDMLKDVLSKKSLLFILDNCEHLIEACAHAADEILHAAPHVHILATSREGLGISGESSYPVRSLSLPTSSQISADLLSQYDAVRLFIDRAIAVQPNFQVTNQNAPAVAEVCARLDGIPLAIELAAARVKGLSVEQIAARLYDRFRLLSGGSRTALPRHRTLQATIDWSYKLLEQEERALFRRLSVFAGGWTLEAAEEVCASQDLGSDQILDLLLRLVDKSLVVADIDASGRTNLDGGSLRYHMLETIRQYAQEKLDEEGESKQARDHHLSYVRTLAEQAAPHLTSSQQALWLQRLEAEHDNIRAALEWAQQGGDPVAGLELATYLLMFWILRAYLQESVLAFNNLLSQPLPKEEYQLLANAHNAAGWLEHFLENQTAALAHARESERFCLQLGEAGKVDLARIRNLLIDVEFQVDHDAARARQRYEANLKVFQEAGDLHEMAHIMGYLGELLYKDGDTAGAYEIYEQGHSLFLQCGDRARAAQENTQLAILELEMGRYSEARGRCEENLSFYRQAQVNFTLEAQFWILGAIAVREQDYDRAKALYRECLLFTQQLGEPEIQLPECLIGFAGIAHAEKKFTRAAQLAAVAKARSTHLSKFDQVELERLTAALRQKLGTVTFEDLAACGRAMAVEQAITLALETSNE